MTSSVHFLPTAVPTPQPQRVVIVAFEGAQVLDVTGPAAVFTSTNRQLGYERYQVRILSSSGKPVRTSGAVTIATEPLSAVPARSVHTLLISGGEAAGVLAAIRDPALERWVLRASAHSKRFGSVCSGSFVLAAYGLLDGKRAATHWVACERLQRMYPGVQVDADSLYVVDGKVWTSAGVTTGIDMSLAMVEADVGASTAAAVAQQLVVYARRPGYQSQFSAVLRAQSATTAPYQALVEWIVGNLEKDLDVTALAKRAGQSPRDFHRKFSAATGLTPARFVENLRLERVRLLLNDGSSLKEIAARTGFGGVVRLSRAFERRFGVKPSLFRELQ